MTSSKKRVVAIALLCTLSLGAQRATADGQIAGGYERHGFAGFRLRPDIAVRASWNQSYVSGDGSTYRTVPAVPFLVWRAQLADKSTVYVGLHASLTDLLGPLAEVVLRPNEVPMNSGMMRQTAWHDQQRLLANFIQPRVAVEVGLPSRSRHLLLDLGVSARAVTPNLADDFVPHNGFVSVDYDYRFFWNDNATFMKGLEIAFSLKYVP